MPPANASLPDVKAGLVTQLQQGCDELGLSVNSAQRDQLLSYLYLLGKWNKTYNLTAVRDEAQMVTRHLLDSLSIAVYLTGWRILDVGTGAGLPGVPLAILFPEREFHLLDSNGKKTRFLFQVKTALCLDNMVVHQARAESFQVDEPFDTVLSRAFASLQDTVRDCRHLLAPGGRLLAMKGAHPTQELDILSQHSVAVATHLLSVPGLREQRHLVEIAV